MSAGVRRRLSTENAVFAAGHVPTADVPVITIIGANPVRVEESSVGDYQDMSAVCQDKADGDISNHLQIKGTVINLSTPGTYQVHYTCTNSQGVKASPKSRTIIVLAHKDPNHPVLCPHPNPTCVPARPGCAYHKSEEKEEHGCLRFPCGELRCEATLAACPNLQEAFPCNAFPCPVDCIQNSWSNWSTCSRSCGTGYQQRGRTTVTHAAFGGKACGISSTTRVCNPARCPIDCEVTAFSPWTTCSKSCGGGMKTRQRGVNIFAAFGGVPCPTNLYEVAPCKTDACPVDCVVSTFTPWSACSKSCGVGEQTRTRTIDIETESGGKVCPDLSETQQCEGYKCTQDCIVSAFTEYTTCTKSCGGGSRSRSRSVLHAAAWGGQACPLLVEVETCKTDECPVDCIYGAWSSWSPCGKTCGGGTTTRSRSIERPMAWGGKACPNTNDVLSCNTSPCPIDGAVEEWTQWTPCTLTCGPGTQSRSRAVINYPQFGGVALPLLEETQDCNTGPCPVHCVVSEFSAWTGCAQSCGATTPQTRSRSIIVMPAHGGTICPDLEEKRKCNTSPCPVDCVQTPFTPWSHCSATCAEGTVWRMRQTVTHPAHGGIACGVPFEQQPCNNGPCPVHCQVSLFTEWTTCSKSCGGGTQSRARTVVRHPNHGGYQCPSLGEERQCNTMYCAVDCVVGEWGTWESYASGGANVRRTRPITTPVVHGGAACPHLSETKVWHEHYGCMEHDKLGSWSQCTKDCDSGVRYRYREHVSCSHSAVVKMNLKFRQAQRCNTASCAAGVVSPVRAVTVPAIATATATQLSEEVADEDWEEWRRQQQ